VEVYSADWVLPVTAPPVENGAVAIEDGRIVAVGPSSELGEGRRFAGAAIVPGLVNAHSHLEYAVYAGFGDALPFAPWIAIHIARKGLIGVEDMEAIARLGAAECLASGITTVADASYSGAAATACADLGLRAIVYIEVFGAGTDQIETRFEAYRDRVGGALSERVRLGVSPHSVYSASVELWRAAARLGLPMMTHFAESDGELEWVHGRSGPFAGVITVDVGANSIRMLAESGLLSARVTAAHCVVVDEQEIDLLARHDVGVAHCPRSNALLGCGIAPVEELLAAGVRVGIGTDSPASTPSFDMFEEMRAAVALARLRSRRPDTMPAGRALELATIGSAAAIGLEQEIGSIERGKRGDLAVIDLDGSPFVPWEDPAAAVVLGGSPGRVVTTLVDGEVRYERNTFVWQELRQRGIEARSRLLGL
jgi:cytosine/adenosine deaminase-related metal-dependent hydrolase